MPTSVTVIVGTRKGCFLLESDGDRRDWEMRGPFCDGWPVYHAIHDAASGTLFAACASEWHGAGVWRSSDLGENWELSSEGLSYGEDGDLKLSKVSGLTAAHGRLLAGAGWRACGTRSGPRPSACTSPGISRCRGRRAQPIRPAR